MTIVVNLIYEPEDRVSFPQRKRFEGTLSNFALDAVKLCLGDSVVNPEVDCVSFNLKKDQYCEIQKKNS